MVSSEDKDQKYSKNETLEVKDELPPRRRKSLTHGYTIVACLKGKLGS